MKSFDEYYSKYHEEMRGYISRNVHSNDVDDISQMVWFKFFSTLNENINNPHGWLYALAKNTIIDSWRKKRHLEYAPHLDSIVDEHVVYSDEREKLSEGIENLSKGDRELIDLRYRHCKDICEIADHLNIGSVAVRTRVHRAKKKLKNLIMNSSTQNL